MASLPVALARQVIQLAPKGTGFPDHVHVTQWGTPLDSAQHVLFYFGGMPTSGEEPLLHSVASDENRDIYASRKVHLVVIDRPGMGGTPVAYRFHLRRDWPRIVATVADELRLPQQYSVMGMSNRGPYAMACLTHPELKHRVKAGTIVVGVSDVWASSYFSWKHPSHILEGLFNSLPIFITGPITALGLHMTNLYLMRLGGFESGALFPKMPASCKPTVEHVISSSAKNWGLGASIDCQQGLSPFYARSTTNHDLSHVDQNALSAYRSIEQPVSLWYGNQDSLVPMSTADWLHGVIPHSTLHKIDGDHSLLMTNAASILDATIAMMEEETSKQDGEAK